MTIIKSKPILTFCAYSVMWASCMAQAQDVDAHPETTPPPDPSKIRFVPPPMPAPAPAMRVEASTLSDFGTHQIEILLGTASDLPDIPPPPVASPPSADRKPRAFKPRYLLHITMTVYDKQISHLKWQDPVSKEKFEAWCQWDASLVGPMHQIKTSSADYLLSCFPRMIDTTRASRIGRFMAIPEHPALLENQHLITQGDPAQPGGDEIMQCLSAYYLKHQTTLRELRVAQETYNNHARAWRQANPPKPENHTIWLKPHRGSRYLDAAKREGQQ
jgi:hypothetical protein